MIKIGILGATGYAGSELVRLLLSRDDVEIVFLDSNSYGGLQYSNLYPNFKDIVDMECTSMDIIQNDYFSKIDILFCALPHGLTQKAVKAALEAGLKVIDLSADFRIADPGVYESWYNTEHIAREQLKTAVYGLSEVYRDEVSKTELVANPGCYPTSILLPLYPLLKSGSISVDSIISDSKSGVSGAGRSLNDANLYSQVSESLKAYGIGVHRHTPEIEEQLGFFANRPIRIQFTPHLIPMLRGILSTIYIQNTASMSENSLGDILNEYYADEYFVRIHKPGSYPCTKAVSGSNFIDIGYKVDDRTGNIILVSVIDNLIKGASGQAIQNMNIMLGLPENTGLKQLPLWP